MDSLPSILSSIKQGLSVEGSGIASCKKPSSFNSDTSLDLRGCNFCKKYPCIKYHSPKYEKCPFQDFELSYEFSKISKITKLLRHKKPFFIANLNFLKHELLKAKNYEFLPIFQLKRRFEGFNLTYWEKYNFPTTKRFSVASETPQKPEKWAEINEFYRRKKREMRKDYINFQEENILELFKKAEKEEILKKIDFCSTKYQVFSCEKHPLEKKHTTKKIPNSCDKLLCPKCSEDLVVREVKDAYKRLSNLSGRYWQITFTLPVELRDKVRWLQKRRTVKNGFIEIKDYGIQRFFNVIYRTLKKTFTEVPIKRRGKVSYVKIYELGGLAGVHTFSTENPAEIKPHISVIMPSKLVQGKKAKFVNFFSLVDECRMWYRCYLEKEFGWIEPNPVVEFEYFGKKKLHHKVRYLLRNPIEMKRLFQIGENEFGYVREGLNKEKGNDITNHEILLWNSDNVVRILKTHYAKNKHRYRWFGYLSYNSWKNYHSLFRKKEIEEFLLCKCGSKLSHIGDCNEEGEYVYLNWVYEFLIEWGKIRMCRERNFARIGW